MTHMRNCAAALAVLAFAIAGQQTAFADAGGSGNSIIGKHKGSAVVVNGTGGSVPAAGGQSSEDGAPTSISVTCGTESQGQLDRLGDLDPAQSRQTCADQVVICKISSVGHEKELDPVVTVEQPADGTWQFAGNACVADGPARVTAAMVREAAVRLIPSAKVGVAPKGTTLVNIETVLWADAPRRQELAPVTILGQRVVVGIVLDHVTWSFGDGTSEAGPAGKAYDAKGDPCRSKICSHYFGHTYRTTGTVQVSATATWHATFSVAGGAPVDIPGTVDGPASQADLVVKQARGVLVPNPGEQR